MNRVASHAPPHAHALPELPQERWSKPMALTIDGPAGSGKSTIAQHVAETLGFRYIDTGATYRAVAWLALREQVALDDAPALAQLARAHPVMLGYRGQRWCTLIAGRDVTEEIRSPEVSHAASQVACHDELRDVLVARQRELSLERDTVLEGRDCGTRVRPDAELKLHLTASPEERARRRAAQSADDDAGSQRTVVREREVLDQIVERDARDRRQSEPAATAVEVDTTNHTVDEVVDEVVELWLRRRQQELDDEVVAGRTAREWIENEFAPTFERWYRYTGWFWRRAFRLEAHGVERVPQRNCLFIANHNSLWDPAFLIMPLARPIRYMAKVELLQNPATRHLGDVIGAFPVRRGGGDRVSLHIAESVLRRGDSLGIFPEGTRIHADMLGRARQGAARTALVTGVPVVPVAIYGSRYAESAFKVRVAFGNPHDFSTLRATPTNVERATADVWDDVQELWTALRLRSRERWKRS